MTTEPRVPGEGYLYRFVSCGCIAYWCVVPDLSPTYAGRPCIVERSTYAAAFPDATTRPHWFPSCPHEEPIIQPALF